MAGIIVLVLWIWGVVAFFRHPKFGRLPRGERLERIRRSPHYRGGQFHNLQPTAQITSGKGRFGVMWSFLFRPKRRLRPDEPISVRKPDLKELDRAENLIVWFGHSSYLLQIDGVRILADPVFCEAAPVAFLNRPFRGTDVFSPEDMPDVDYLVITHDHWDHLDYRTVVRLKGKVSKVVCPLGVGAHFERWGFASEKLIELDWGECSQPEAGVLVRCFPARHFSGRGLRPNRTLWASFLIETASQKVFLGGDGGYGSHFSRIGKSCPGITLAVLENGQYSEDWKYIHTMPEYLGRIAEDLRASTVITVHHSKYALARHPWDEPLSNERKAAQDGNFRLILPEIGEIVRLDKI